MHYIDAQKRRVEGGKELKDETRRVREAESREERPILCWRHLSLDSDGQLPPALGKAAVWLYPQLLLSSHFQPSEERF